MMSLVKEHPSSSPYSSADHNISDPISFSYRYNPYSIMIRAIFLSLIVASVSAFARSPFSMDGPKRPDAQLHR